MLVGLVMICHTLMTLDIESKAGHGLILTIFEMSIIYKKLTHSKNIKKEKISSF